MSEDGEMTQDSTIKPANERRIKSDTLKKAPPQQQKIDLSRQDLIRLLSYLEGELQARDIVIATIKSETAKQLLYQAKYGRLGLTDPLAALQRDSEACASTDDFDESSVGRMYESQLGQLEKLITVQRRAHHRAKQVLAAAERRHARTVRELDDERQRRAQDAAQGDDVCMMLEKERERLKQEIEIQKTDYEKLEKELEKMKQQLVEEKERRKEIVLYLLQERRQLMIRLMEERLKVQSLTGAPSQQQQQHGGAAFGQQNENLVKKLKAELDATKNQLDKERDETASLREIIQTQENDLNLIRQTIFAKSRQQQHQMSNNNNGPPMQQQQQNLHKPSGQQQQQTVAKQQAPLPPGSTSSATVRYQILTRPAAPGSSSSEFPAKYSSAPNVVDHHQHQYHAMTSSPVQSPSPTIRLMNPAFQSPQLSPQASRQQRSGFAPPPYSALEVTSSSSAGGGSGANVHHYNATSAKLPPTPQQYASFGVVINSPSGAKRPPTVSSPVKSAPGGVVTSSLLNGYSSPQASSNNSNKRPGGAPVNGPLSLGGRPPIANLNSDSFDSSSFRLGSTPPSRVALTQLPPSGNFALGNNQQQQQQRSAGDSSTGTARRKAPSSSQTLSGAADSQQQVRIANLHNPTSEDKVVRSSNGGESTEPEIAHLEAVINSMAVLAAGHVTGRNGGNDDVIEFADEDSSEFFVINNVVGDKETVKVSTDVPLSGGSPSYLSSASNSSQNSRAPGVTDGNEEVVKIDNSETSSSPTMTPGSGHNTWSPSSNTPRRFPTTTSAPVIFNRSVVSASPPYVGGGSIVVATVAPPGGSGKRAPTPAPTNRIPLPLNGALTKSLSTGSASPTPKGHSGAQAIGQRVSKAVSGIAGKMQNKIVSSGSAGVAKRPSADHPVRSTQV